MLRKNYWSMYAFAYRMSPDSRGLLLQQVSQVPATHLERADAANTSAW